MAKNEIKGSCGVDVKPGITYDAMLDSWWDDVAKLIKHTNHDISNFYTDDDRGASIRRNLQAWFGITWDTSKHEPTETERQKQLQRIINTFEQLERFVDGKFEWKMGWKEQEQRQIYCDSNWLPETTLVYNTDGDKMTDSSGRDLSIHNKDDVKGAFTDWEDYTILFEGSSVRTRKARAYWSPYHKKYAVIPGMRYDEGPDELRHYCHGAGGTGPATGCTDSESFGTLDKEEDEDLEGEERYTADSDLIMILCPNAFTSPKADTSENSVTLWAENKKLADVLPGSLTLLHELVHVVIGPVSSPDGVEKGNSVVNDVYGVPKVLQTAKDRKLKWDMSHLPESYALLAFSYWATTGDGIDERFDWTSGRARP
ncbi:hypothetical protein BCR34DRAFT_603568 [Clohesyomyces aquaticus]|uniref:Lysine-specific metallo-endopeptidase domain-containing protein n=1 Tax=Clohesyomyces aquaticus TaxID=1231657 RepID=A0A1Y1ZF77_9PLEO|nr:hypothetical protein BCR34DRAFT_603568 [Clohesyomyces aquaticus]